MTRILLGLLLCALFTTANLRADEKRDLLDKINAARREQKHDLAVELAGRLIALDADDPTGHIVRARLQADRGRFSDALPDWDELVRLSPEADVLNQRGRICFQAGKIAEAAGRLRSGDRVEAPAGSPALGTGNLLLLSGPMGKRTQAVRAIPGRGR
ncbi:MAG: hypothetical protein QM811_27010 [Pirellulales bacterium]